jgi:hypothetical protein
MAFIVQMWWGKPHEIIVEDVDEDGELYVSHVIPNGPPDPERRTFACSWWNWQTAQQVAHAFGWQPAGPLFRSWSDKTAPPVRVAAYDPDGWINGIHDVDAEDARAWGQALERCLEAVDSGAFQLPDVKQPALIADGMDLNGFRQANRGFTPQFLRAFASFLSKGRFTFGWDS